MVTNYAPLVAALFLVCYERDFMMSLSDDKQTDIIDAFNTTSRYLDDKLNINNVDFDNRVSQIHPSELQLDKDNTSGTKTAFLDLHLSIYNAIVSTKIYDKRDDFDFEIVIFPILDGDVPTSYGVCIYQLIRFARASSHVAAFNTCNKLLTQKLPIGIINFAKPFLSFIEDTMICCNLNSKLDSNRSCAKDFQNLNSMVTWCIN